MLTFAAYAIAFSYVIVLYTTFRDKGGRVDNEILKGEMSSNNRTYSLGNLSTKKK